MSKWDDQRKNILSKIINTATPVENLIDEAYLAGLEANVQVKSDDKGYLTFLGLMFGHEIYIDCNDDDVIKKVSKYLEDHAAKHQHNGTFIDDKTAGL